MALYSKLPFYVMAMPNCREKDTFNDLLNLVPEGFIADKVAHDLKVYNECSKLSIIPSKNYWLTYFLDQLLNQGAWEFMNSDIHGFFKDVEVELIGRLEDKVGFVSFDPKYMHDVRLVADAIVDLADMNQVEEFIEESADNSDEIFVEDL